MASLHKASERGHSDVAAVLLGAGARPTAQDNGLRSPLLLAASKSHWELASLLLARGPAAAAAPDRTGMTPLHYAARQNRESLAAELLAAGADPFHQTNDGMNAVDVAAQGSNVRRVLQTAPLR